MVSGDSGSSTESGSELANPILNSPYAPPERHFELGPNGPTGTVLTGRPLGR